MENKKQELIDLLLDDGYAISFQSMRQYRNALIKHLKSINSPEPVERRAIGENKQAEEVCECSIEAHDNGKLLIINIFTKHKDYVVC